LTDHISAIAYLKASNTEPKDNFGYSVILSGDGNTLAVGTPFEDSGSRGVDGNQQDNSALDSGAVYIFVKKGTEWQQQAYLKSLNSDEKDNFGAVVSLSSDGNILAIGAPWEDSSSSSLGNNNAEIDSGAVYIFTRAGQQWQQNAYLKASNAQSDDFFGDAVSLSGDGNYLAVGAPGEDSGDNDPLDNSVQRSGVVYIFYRINSSWTQVAYLKSSNVGQGDEFGVLSV